MKITSKTSVLKTKKQKQMEDVLSFTYVFFKCCLSAQKINFYKKEIYSRKWGTNTFKCIKRQTKFRKQNIVFQNNKQTRCNFSILLFSIQFNFSNLLLPFILFLLYQQRERAKKWKYIVKQCILKTIEGIIGRKWARYR